MQVIAVGAYDGYQPSGLLPNSALRSPPLMCYSGRGPTKVDGRIKPDILAPTNIETAYWDSSWSKISGDQRMAVFPGTSSATPSLAGKIQSGSRSACIVFVPLMWKVTHAVALH